jgi:hypothetical protein
MMVPDMLILKPVKVAKVQRPGYRMFVDRLVQVILVPEFTQFVQFFD